MTIVVGPSGRAMALTALLLGGCSANREGARALADAGIGATSALSLEIDHRAERVSRKIAAQNFNYAYSSMRNCRDGQNWSITIADGPEPICDVIATVEARPTAVVSQRLAALAEIMRLRARAVERLGAAYRALGTEADYKAREELERAITAATASATQLGTALGIGAVPEVLAGGVTLIGGQLAEGAQQRRLIRGSERLQAITSHLKRALEREQTLLEEVDALAGDRILRYTIGGETFDIGLPAAGLPPRIAYASCNGFSSLKAMKGVNDKNALWKHMALQHRKQPFNLLMLGGDQAYADSMWETVPVMRDWAALDFKAGNKTPATPEMIATLQSFYFDLYTSRWSQPEVRPILASVPTMMMWDDHDLIDGWGAYPDGRQNSAVYQKAIWPAAERAFRTFQQQLRPGEKAPGAVGAARGFSFGHVVGRSPSSRSTCGRSAGSTRCSRPHTGSRSSDGSTDCPASNTSSSCRAYRWSTPASTRWRRYSASGRGRTSSRTTWRTTGTPGRTRASGCASSTGSCASPRREWSNPR